MRAVEFKIREEPAEAPIKPRNKLYVEIIKKLNEVPLGKYVVIDIASSDQSTADISRQIRQSLRKYQRAGLIGGQRVESVCRHGSIYVSAQESQVKPRFHVYSQGKRSKDRPAKTTLQPSPKMRPTDEESKTVAAIALRPDLVMSFASFVAKFTQLRMYESIDLLVSTRDGRVLGPEESEKLIRESVGPITDDGEFVTVPVRDRLVATRTGPVSQRWLDFIEHISAISDQRVL